MRVKAAAEDMRDGAEDLLALPLLRSRCQLQPQRYGPSRETLSISMAFVGRDDAGGLGKEYDAHICGMVRLSAALSSF